MKPKIKKALKGLRLFTAPLRHPWREFQRTIEAGVWNALQQGHSRSNFDPGETALLLDHLVRELVRLQQPVDVLQLTVDQLVPEQEKMASGAGTIEPTQGWHETPSRLKAG